MVLPDYQTVYAQGTNGVTYQEGASRSFGPRITGYLWAGVPAKLGMSDTEFARALFAEQHVTVLPGSYLAREAQGSNPGAQRVRMALVADTEECVEAALRIVQFIQSRTA